MLRELGHAVVIDTRLPERPFDVLVALHAKKSGGAVLRCREIHPGRPIVVVLTGTDLHRDIHHEKDAQRSLDLADRLIVLYPGAERSLSRRHRRKAALVVQSSPPIRRPDRPRPRTFDVAVVGHLRSEKDPFRTALAARLLPPDSRIRVLHAGKALSADMARAARAEARRNPRYEWLGELRPARARALIARSRVLSLTSEMEGGANVLSEAAAAGTAILASRIPCTEGLLGVDHPGLFPFGDTRALADLLDRAERDGAFLRDLEQRSRALGERLSPEREKRAWEELLRSLAA
jgi:putative glycosyltransferase (TIGR04348 family)